MFTKSSWRQSFSSLPISKTKVRQLVIFALTFGGLKLNAISMALILSNLFPSLEAFGAFEYALSIGLIATVILNLGLTGAIPFYLIKRKQKNFLAVFYFHGLLILFCFLIVLRFFFWEKEIFPPNFILSLSIATIFSLQILAAVIAKSKGKIYQAVFLEGAFFLLLNGYNLWIYLFARPASLEDIQIVLWLQISLLLIFYAYQFWQEKIAFKWSNYTKALNFGRPLIIGGFLIMALTSSGRIFTAYFFSLESVGMYGLYFRLTALVVLLHQVVNIAFFKKLYAGKSDTLDTWFEAFLIIILIVSAISYCCLPFIAQNLFTAVANSWPEASTLFIGLSFQMFFWIGIALFENVIFREKLSTSFNRKLFPILIIMLLTLFLMNTGGILNLIILVGVNTIMIYLAIELQLSLLRKKKMPFPKTTSLIRALAFLQLIFLTFQF